MGDFERVYFIVTSTKRMVMVSSVATEKVPLPAAYCPAWRKRFNASALVVALRLTVYRR